MSAAERDNTSPQALLEALQRPEAYPHGPDAVTALQTHISLLFFAGDRVYKVKKPLELDFLDYSTPERRLHYCREEVRLNSRLAPGIYRGVAAIVRREGGALRIIPADEADDAALGEAVEYAVEMHCLPERHMFDRLLASGRIDNAMVDAIVKRIAEFHRECATGAGVDEHGEPDKLLEEVSANFEALKHHASPGTSTEAVLTPAMQAHLETWMTDFMTRERGLFERRVTEGRIREGHGDLHAGNLCLLDEGIVAYDCIEFSPAFRCRDVACEIAFLAMDLDFRGYRGFAAQLVRRYVEQSGDRELPSLLTFYKMHLALVRAKVAALRAQGEGIDESERQGALAEARRYAQLAASYHLEPILIVMCGLPGSGKSWAARALAAPFEARVLQSDAVRKRMAGFRPEERIPDSQKDKVYSAEMSRRTYGALRDQATQTIAQGRSVILDATFQQDSHRREFVDLARELHIPAVIAYMDCPENLVRERLAARGQQPGEISDADWEVYTAMRERFETPRGDQVATLPPVDDPTLLPPLVIDTLISRGNSPKK